VYPDAAPVLVVPAGAVLHVFPVIEYQPGPWLLDADGLHYSPSLTNCAQPPT
jgi:hypothetical protein